MRIWLITILLILIPIKIQAMADYKILKPIILKYEGGFVNDPIDSGGATNSGVTLGTFRAYYGKDKTEKDLRNMSEKQWDEIFINLYWNRWLGNEIKHQSIANILVDWLYNSGIYGIKIPQQVLGVQPDGIVGKKTLDAINSHPYPKLLFEQLKERRRQYYLSIAVGKRTKYKNGWLRRNDSFNWID